MIRFQYYLAALTVNAGLLVATQAQAGSWQNGAPFGATLQGDLYTPTTPGTSPAILVAIHYCTGNKSVVHSWFQSYAEQYGFYIIAPDAGKQCFDSSLSRDGDKAAIVKMVNYVLGNTQADKNRVFAAGLSSGGCMTNTLLAAYPDVFAGGAAMPGFPAGAWPAGDTTCTKCSSQPPNTTGAQWADMVTKVYKYDGTRPCVQQWVGGGDEYNFNGWLPAVAAEFQALSNLGAGTSGTGAPSGWTRTEYKDSEGHVRLQTNLGPTSQKHDLSSANLWGQVVSFLGLDKATGACGISSSGGGSSSTGGAAGVGGSSALGAGGTKATGGSSSVASGGAATGGNNATGGVASTATGGASAATTGGGKSTGGSPSSATGGSKSTGGAFGIGGATTHASSATGGNSSTQSTTAASATGGRSVAASTQASAQGGSDGLSTTGNEATGGHGLATTSAVRNTSESTTKDDGGCGCRVTRSDRNVQSLWGVGLLGVALGAWRRRRQPRR